MMNTTYNNSQAGVTLIELLIGFAISSIILGAIVLFYARGAALSREQFEQVLNVEESRIALERMGDVIRNGRNVDLDADTVIEEGEGWLVTSEPDEIQIYTDINGDNQPEKVRYTVVGTTIERGVVPRGEDGQFSGEEQVQPVFSFVRNIEEDKPLFLYGSSGARSVTISLYIDVKTNQAPSVAHISTSVFPRGELSSSNSTFTPRLWPIDIAFPQDPPVDDAVQLTLTNPDTSVQATEVIGITELDDSRVKTYNDAFPIHINYQTIPVGDTLPGWYAWIGPITTGQYQGYLYTVTDKVPLANLCTGADLAAMLQDCPTRTVSQGPFSRTYQPILRYIQPDTRNHDYIKGITLDFAGE